MHPQDPAGRPEGDAGGDALPVRLPQPVSESTHSDNDNRSHFLSVFPELLLSSRVVSNLSGSEGG